MNRNAEKTINTENTMNAINTVNTVGDHVDNFDAADFKHADLLLDPGTLRDVLPGLFPDSEFAAGLARRMEAQAKATTPQLDPPIQPAMNHISEKPTFTAVMTELQEVARKLDKFHLRVSLHWKKNPEKTMPPPELIKIPEIPRYVSEDRAKEASRVDLKRYLAMERLKKRKTYNDW